MSVRRRLRQITGDDAAVLRSRLRRERRRDLLRLLPAFTMAELDELRSVVAAAKVAGVPVEAARGSWLWRAYRRARLRCRFGFASEDGSAVLLSVSVGAGGSVVEGVPVVTRGGPGGSAGPMSCVAGEWGCGCVDVALEVPHAVRGGRAGVLAEAARWHERLVSGREWRVSMRRAEARSAALALDLLPRLEEEARERQALAGGANPGTLPPELEEAKGEAAEKAAALVRVGRSTVAAAKQIIWHDRDGAVARVVPEAERPAVDGVEVDVNGNPVVYGPAAFAEDLGGRPEPGSAAWIMEREW